MIILLLAGRSVLAQESYSVANIDDLVQQLNLNQAVSGNAPDIQGSPYLIDEFTEGEIFFDGKYRIPEIALRLNLSNGELEFKKNNVVLAMSNPSRINKVVMGEYTLVYIPKQKKGKVEGFVRRWHEKLPCIITKMESEFLKKEAAKAYVDPKPARFERLTDKHYIMKSPTEIEKVTSVKKLIKYLGKHEEALSSFAKKEKVSSGNVQELVELLNYYHSLN